MLRLAGTALAVAVVATVTACGSERESAPRAQVDQCVEKMLVRAQGEPKGLVRDYLRRTYCEPFAKKGWVHSDGTISIRAHEWLLGAGACEMVKGEPPTTTACDPRSANEAPLLECALLHFVRRTEVRPYLEDLQRRRGKVECDDGTPLDELGVAT